MSATQILSICVAAKSPFTRSSAGVTLWLRRVVPLLRPRMQPRSRACRRWPAAPAVVSASRNPEHLAHELDREARLLRLDEPVRAHRVPSSRAKKTAAFFRNSLSCLRVLFSRRSLLSSSRSEVVSPSRSPSSTSYCLIHRLKDSLAIPNSSAIFGIDLSEER